MAGDNAEDKSKRQRTQGLEGCAKEVDCTRKVIGTLGGLEERNSML